MIPRYDPQQCDYPGYTDAQIRVMLSPKAYALWEEYTHGKDFGVMDGQRFVHAMEFWEWAKKLKVITLQ